MYELEAKYEEAVANKTDPVVAYELVYGRTE